MCANAFTQRSHLFNSYLETASGALFVWWQNNRVVLCESFWTLRQKLHLKHWPHHIWIIFHAEFTEISRKTLTVQTAAKKANKVKQTIFLNEKEKKDIYCIECFQEIAIKMKDIAGVDYVAGELEIFEDDGLCESTNSLKVVIDTVDDELNDEFVGQRASSNSNLEEIDDKEMTISHARSENMIPILTKKKNRLISTDSGFGSYGMPCEMYTSGSVDSMAYTSSGPKYTSIHTRPIIARTTQQTTKPIDATISTEQDDKVSPLISDAAVAEAKPRRERDSKHKNNRNTTLNSIDDHFELDPRLINRDDGFHEVQCYINEHGSPIVREKSRTHRKKSTLREELKARSLGASYDDNLLLKDPKTPSCVSFSRLFKKLRETFCKWYR